jgi:hypothetical protein
MTGPRVPLADVAKQKIKALEWNKEVVKLEPPKPARWYDRAWAWANGKKFYAGVAMIVGGGVVQVVPGLNAAGWPAIGKGLVLLGSSFATIGGIHKLLKWTPSIGKKGSITNKDLMVFTIKVAIKILTLIYEVVKAWDKKK